MKVTLGKLRDGLKRITLREAQGLTSDIILSDINILTTKANEFKRGENPDGSTIGEYSNSPIGQEYRSFKLQLNPLAGGTVDLTLTGALRDGLTTEYLGKGLYIIFSQDNKWEELKEKYGDQISLIKEEDWLFLQGQVYAPQLNEALRRLSGL